MAIGDLNGDGRLDLATANSLHNSVTMLFGNGKLLLTFGPGAYARTGDSPGSVVIGDVSGDGNPDLATANIGSNTVSVFLGNGTGAFGAKTDFGTGYAPLSSAIGNVNADGSRI